MNNPFLWLGLLKGLKKMPWIILMGIMMAYVFSIFDVKPRNLVFFVLPLLNFSLIIRKNTKREMTAFKRRWCYPYTFHDWVWLNVWTQLVASVFIFLAFLGSYYVFTSQGKVYWSLSVLDVLWFSFFLIPLLTFGYFYMICLIKIGNKATLFCGLYLLAIAFTVHFRVEIIGYVLLSTASLFFIRLIEEKITLEDLFKE